MGIKQDSVEWHETAYRFADFMVKECKKRGIENIIFLGDFYNNRNTISVITLNAANVFMEHLKDFQLHMVLGNHDLYYSSDYEVSGVNLFGNWDNIKVYSTPQIVKFGSKTFNMCGWGYNPLDYKADVLCTHLEIAMFKFNDKVPENVEGVKCSELLERYDKVFAGHFHLRQCRTYNNGEIRYTGNPFPMDYSDEGKDKGFEILDTETGEVEFVVNTTAPAFVRFKLSEMVEFVKANGYEALENKIRGNYFKLIVDRNITLSDLDDLDNLIISVKPANYSHEWDNGRDFSQKIDSKDYSINSSEFDMQNIISSYCALLDVPTSMKTEVKEYMLDIFRRVEESKS